MRRTLVSGAEVYCPLLLPRAQRIYSYFYSHERSELTLETKNLYLLWLLISCFLKEIDKMKE